MQKNSWSDSPVNHLSIINAKSVDFHLPHPVPAPRLDGEHHQVRHRTNLLPPKIWYIKKHNLLPG